MERREEPVGKTDVLKVSVSVVYPQLERPVSTNSRGRIQGSLLRQYVWKKKGETHRDNQKGLKADHPPKGKAP
jgi:hypothetical protein